MARIAYKAAAIRRPTTTHARKSFLGSRTQVLKDLCILDFHSKSPDLVTIILDLSKVTVPEE